MKTKTDEIEDKALKPDAGQKTTRKPRGGVNTPPESIVAAAASIGVEIRMKTGRQWRLGDRMLRPGERVTLDASTAAAIVAADYAYYTEG